MIEELRRLIQGEEVLLTGLAAQGAHMDGFNPYYGLVVNDNNDPDLLCRRVLILWEDGMERNHFRGDVTAWCDLPEGILRP